MILSYYLILLSSFANQLVLGTADYIRIVRFVAPSLFLALLVAKVGTETLATSLHASSSSTTV